MIRPERIAHVVLKVRDLARSRAFYTEVLGMEVMNDSPQAGLLFLANNRRDHHELALVEMGPDAPSPDRGAIGMAHVAFRLETQEQLEQAYAELKQREIPISFTVNHGITNSVYFFDPDGHELEVYCDNEPETFADMPNSYLGMDKLSYASSDRGLGDVLREMGLMADSATDADD